jgi:hypothetical protein
MERAGVGQTRWVEEWPATRAAIELKINRPRQVPPLRGRRSRGAEGRPIGHSGRDDRKVDHNGAQQPRGRLEHPLR